MNALVLSCFVVVYCVAIALGQGTTGIDTAAAAGSGSTGSTGQMSQLATLMALSGGGNRGGSSRGGGMGGLFSNPMMRMALLSGGGSDAMADMMTLRCLTSASMDPMCMMMLFNGGLGGMF